MFAASKTASVTGGYQISRSLRFNSADTTYLNRTPASASNQKTWTYSGWVKRSKLGAFQALMASSNTYIQFTSSDTIEIDIGTGTAYRLGTTPVYRDVSAWYHVVVVCDTTLATATDRLKLYVNSTQITALSASSYTGIPQNQNTNFNSTLVHWVGGNNIFGDYNNGYMTEVNFIDGQALTPSSFGETNAQTGVWQPKAYSGSYGTNGFYLNFSDNSNTTAATLGKDYSGNGNNWTPNNFSVSAGAGNDSLVDSPTSYGTDTGVGGTVRGNYATLNPLFITTSSGITNPTLANGNLSFVGNVTTDTSGRSTIGVTSGKWYCEVTVSYVSAIQDGLGIAYTQSDSSRTVGVLYRASGDKCVNNTVTSYGTNYVAGSLIGIALDADANTVTFYNSNNSQGAISFTPTTAIYFSTYGTNASPAFAGDINFGQRPFAYTAPSGFKALCTQNLPTPTIGATTATLAGKYFNAVTYTGTGSSLGVTGVGFQPDLVWVKSRSAATDHGLYDAVRGVQKQIKSNTTTAETTETTGITAFGADGFTTGALAQLNTSAATYVAWNWKANGSGSTNTAGSITSTVSANTTSGFSVVTYTGLGGAGNSVGHGLGSVPQMIILKQRASATNYNWFVYNQALGNTQYLLLNSTNPASSGVSAWNNQTPTSSAFYLGSYGEVNGSGNTFVAYCFAEVAGYSKFGSFVGNGSATGPFIYTGFRPRFVMIKIASGSTYNTDNWFMFDTARGPYNDNNPYLLANTSGAESAFTAPEMLSNGFFLNTTSNALNYNGSTYIYMAFAEVPLKFSLAQ